MNKSDLKKLQQIESEKLTLYNLCHAAKHLILAAKGPIGGPTSWEDTKDEWIGIFDALPIPAKIKQGRKQ